MISGPWVRAAIASEADGTLLINGIKASQYVLAYSVYNDVVQRATLRLRREYVLFSISEKWVQIWEDEVSNRPWYPHDNSPYRPLIAIRKLGYVLHDEIGGAVTVSVAPESEVWVGNGLDVILKMI